MRTMVNKFAAATVVGLLSLSGIPAYGVDRGVPREESPMLLTESATNSEIAWQGQVEGSPGSFLTQELILASGESVSISVDWTNDQVSVERGGGDVSAISLSELQAFAAEVEGRTAQGDGHLAGMNANPRDINWGSMCQWLSGLTGIGHAAIWSMVSPWIGIPYGVFWLWVGMQCK